MGKSVSAMFRFGVSIFLGVTLLAGVGQAVAQQQCADLLAEMERSAEAGAAARLQKALERMATGTACDEATKNIVSGRIGELVQKTLSSGPTSRVSTAEIEGLLRYAMEHGQSWRTAELLGDRYLETKHYQEAAETYQRGMQLILAEQPPPLPETITNLYKKAEQATLLAPKYVAMTRSIQVQQSTLPIEFEFASTAFTPKGRDAVADLLSLLREEGAPSITLIGHTDPKGGAEYNYKLSLRRAEAVSTYLRQQGYENSIFVDGRGAAEPLPVDNPDRYTQEELYQMYRRVELKR